MSYEILPRQRGCVLICNACQARSTTGQILVSAARVYWRSLGWGKGTDPGQPYRERRPERTIERKLAGGAVQLVKLKARPRRDGRPRTTKWDLCPACDKLDKAAKAERDARKQARKDAINAKRKARWQPKEDA